MRKTKQKFDIFPNKIRNESDMNIINDMQMFNKGNNQYEYEIHDEQEEHEEKRKFRKGDKMIEKTK